jgi:hypothetical protein
MNWYSVGLVASAFACGLLIIFFRYEERRGMRFMHHARTQFDFIIVHIAHTIHRITDTIGRDTVRQIFHYFLHIILRIILTVNKRWEQSLRSMIHINKVMAHTAHKNRTDRNKLEEVALHKLRTALTEEEKKIHKDKMLQG